jgi:hypothetical protein
MATNPFFDFAASASRFVDFDVPTAADLNTPLDEVTSGFDAVDVRIDAIDTDLAGLTDPVQTQLDGKADITGETYSGTHNFTGATAVSVPAPSSGAHAVTKTYADGLVFAAELPDQTGNSGKFVTTNGSTASWAAAVNSINGATGAITGIDKMTYAARATDTAFAAADSTKFIEYTGSFTQTFASAATLGAGWWVVLKNAFTDSVYLTPSGGATIDGVTDFLMYPGEARLLQCDGTNFHSVVLQPFVATFTASGNFFKPPGYKYIGGLIWGGGYSGQRNNNAAAASVGGAGGGCFEFKVPASALSASETVTIGAGGAAVSGVATGNAGGASSLGSHVLVVPGNAYNYGGSVSRNGTTGFFTSRTAVGFDGAVADGAGQGEAVYGGSAAQTDGSACGNTVYGGGCGGSLTAAAAVTAPGSSYFGGDGGAALSAANGSAGSAPGGGGGATQTGTSSGAGARGELRVWGIV